MKIDLFTTVTIAQFFHFVAEEKNKKTKNKKQKKKDDKKTKVFYDWATTGIPVTTPCEQGNWDTWMLDGTGSFESSVVILRVSD